MKYKNKHNQHDIDRYAAENAPEKTEGKPETSGTANTAPAGQFGDNITQAKELEEIRKLLQQAEDEKKKLFEQLQRVSADYLNFQKRLPKQLADSVEYEKKVIIRSILLSIDNFDRALADAQKTQDTASVTRGIQLALEHMLTALKAQGVEQIEAKGYTFNPSLHEAIQTCTDPAKEDNLVLEECRKGYTLNGQLLRPSKVVVNKLPAKPAPAGNDTKPQDQPQQPDTSQ